MLHWKIAYKFQLSFSTAVSFAVKKCLVNSLKYLVFVLPHTHMHTHTTHTQTDTHQSLYPCFAHSRMHGVDWAQNLTDTSNYPDTFLGGEAPRPRIVYVAINSDVYFLED